MAEAILTVTLVTQAYAVYPDRPELINMSTLIKIEGVFAEGNSATKGGEGWLLVMPEVDDASNKTAEMLRWIICKYPSNPAHFTSLTN